MNHLLSVTLKETLKLVEKFDVNDPNCRELEALIVMLYDGSSNHVKMQGDDIDLPTNKLIMGGIRAPMIIDKSGKVIHLEESQSDETLRPLFIIPGKEDPKSQLVREIMERMDREAEANQTIEINIGDVDIKLKINYNPGIVFQLDIYL